MRTQVRVMPTATRSTDYARGNFIAIARDVDVMTTCRSQYHLQANELAYADHSDFPTSHLHINP